MFTTLAPAPNQDHPDQAHNIPSTRRVGRAPNLNVLNNYVRAHNKTKRTDVGICKHCNWRRAWHTTNLQLHLDRCQPYQNAVADGQDGEITDQDALDILYPLEPGPLERDPDAISHRSGALDPAQNGHHQWVNDVNPRPRPSPPAKRPRTDRLPLPTTQTSTLLPHAPPSSQSERELMLEAVLGMVWSILAATGVPETQPSSPLYNLVTTIAPKAVQMSPAPPRHTTPAHLLRPSAN